MADAEPEPKHETQRLGSYAIVRKLARGGMAELFLARSVGPEGFEKLVVLKKILPRYAENPRFVQLFLDEAKLAAGLDHPHIAHVYDMGRVDGHYFFTMEYVHGQDVRAILRRTERTKRRMPIELVVQIGRNVASALHYAHERRRPDGTLREIVHRDVSPSNVLVSYDGAVKLADFGVAKAATSTARTRTGTLKGKVGYMSPEQARGQPIDRRSDIFSLGVMMWELLAVRRLFKTDNDLATIQAIINLEPPSLVQVRDDCPPELQRIIEKALAKDPTVRYQTAQQLQRDLDELAREQRLNQSSIALSSYLNELFESEISAWREAQASGITVTDYLVASNEVAVSESELSVDDDELEPEPELELEDDDEPDAAAAEGEDEEDEPSERVLPPVVGAISNDAELGEEKTTLGPPPVMLDSQITRVNPEPFEAMSTMVSAMAFDGSSQVPTVNPFREELPTVQQARFGEEAQTVQLLGEATTNVLGQSAAAIALSDARNEAPTNVLSHSEAAALLAESRTAESPPRPVHVPRPPTSPMPMRTPTPPVPMPHSHHPTPPVAMPAGSFVGPNTPSGGIAVHGTPQGHPIQPYPMLASQPMVQDGAIDLVPYRKLLKIGGIALGALVLLILIALIASDSPPESGATIPDAALQR
ncbi:MAG: serine/threonine-protein kinase [Kofleriaceae bacterium]